MQIFEMRILDSIRDTWIYEYSRKTRPFDDINAVLFGRMGYAPWYICSIACIPGQTFVNDFIYGQWRAENFHLHLKTRCIYIIENGRTFYKCTQVLDNIVQDKIAKDMSYTNKNHEDEDDDFDPDITLDNLADDSFAKSPRRSNIQSAQLAAKMVSQYSCLSLYSFLFVFIVHI